MAHSLFERMAKANVAVVGDVMLDRYVAGEVARISPEAPVPILKAGRETVRLGGAANVAANIAAYGAGTQLVGVVGDDLAGRELSDLCDAQLGLRTELVADPGRPTTVKTRFLGGWHQLLRLDAEAAHPLPGEAAERLLGAVRAALPGAAALVLSDYDKGVLSASSLPAIIAAGRAAGVPVMVDPKKRDPGLFAGASLLKPNLEEVAVFSGHRPSTDDEAEAACRWLLTAARVDAVLLTRGSGGMTLVRAGEDAAIHVRAATHDVFDVTGAGDAVIASLAVAIAAGADWEEAVRVANAAAGIAVASPGAVTVTLDELRAALHSDVAEGAVTADEAARMVAEWTRKGARVGFTNGCFDLLHRGHLHSLAEAAARVDRLVVGLNSDASVTRLKGAGRPIQDEATRAAVLAALRHVNLVVVFDEETPEALIRKLNPNVLFKGEDYAGKPVAGAEHVIANGGRLELLPLMPGYSTTATIQRMQS